MMWPPVLESLRKFRKEWKSSKRIRNLMFRESSFSEGCLMKNTTCYLVLDGDLDRVVEPLILADREEKLKQSSTEEGK